MNRQTLMDMRRRRRRQQQSSRRAKCQHEHGCSCDGIRDSTVSSSNSDGGNHSISTSNTCSTNETTSTTNMQVKPLRAIGGKSIASQTDHAYKAILPKPQSSSSFTSSSSAKETGVMMKGLPSAGPDVLQQCQQHQPNRAASTCSNLSDNSISSFLMDDPNSGEMYRVSDIGLVGVEELDETHYDDRLVAASSSSSSSTDMKYILGEDGGDLHSIEDDGDSTTDDQEARNEKGRLNFSNQTVYGRSKELAKIHAIFNSKVVGGGDGPTRRDSSGMPTVTFLSGYSGCGKSSLVHEFINQLNLKKRKHLFTSGKFEAMQQGVPFSAFRSLFDFDSIEIGLHIPDDARRNFVKTIGSDVELLCSIIPNLRDIIDFEGDNNEQRGGSTDSWSDDWQKTKIEMSRLKILFKRLFLLFCWSKERPLIIFLDDLHWADSQSLELLKFLLTDEASQDAENSGLRSLFFIGAYRSNEMDGNGKTGSDGDSDNSNDGVPAPSAAKVQPTMKSLLEDVQKTRGDGDDVQIIELSDLSKDSVGQLISETLKLRQKEVYPLTEAIYARTLGNPFFTIQALEQLVRKNVLYYDTVIFRWSWNLRDDVLEQILSESLLDMITSKFDKLEQFCKRALSVGAHIGSKFDIEILLNALNNELELVYAKDASRETAVGGRINKDELVTMLEQAVSDGFLNRSSANSDEFSFAHDQIQDVAAGFISSHERDPFLLRLGNSLATLATSGKGEDWMFFTASQHLNSVNPTYHDDAAKTRLVTLNLRTAELSISLLALAQAAEFAEHGVKNLTHELWMNDHKVTLKLYSICAEAHRGLGHVDRAESLCTTALRQAQKLPRLDAYATLPVENVLLDIFAGKGQKEEALALSLEILGKLGYSFPKREELQRLKAWTYLQDTKSRFIPSDDDIQSLPYITDPMIHDVLELIEKAGSFAFGLGKIPLYVLTRCKQVRWITKHGLTDSSGGALASFANILMHVYGDFDTSVRLADLALVIQTRLKSRYAETRTLNVANFNVLGWVRPLRTRLKYHIQAYESGLVTGNVEGAVTGRWLSYWVHLFAALPLSSLEQDCKTYNEKMRKVGYNFYADLGCLTMQTVQNLMGKSEHTTSLIGEAMDESQEMFSQQKTLEAFTAAHKLFLCVFFGDYKRGAEHALERKDSFKNEYVGCWFGLEPFYRAICLYAMARETGSQTYKAPATRIRKELRVLVDKGCVNLAGLVRLLDGEHAAMLGKKDAAVAYEEAVQLSVNGGFHHNAGLASERYADYLAEKLGDQKRSQEMFEESIKFYSKWGAARKVSKLKQKMAYAA